MSHTARTISFTAMGMNRMIEIDEKGFIVAGDTRTSVDGVFAAGDIVEYPGKVRLISTGFGEAATAVNNAAPIIDPPEPDVVSIRAPEIGAVMVRGRVGGAGDAFNLGEMTVTRCSLRLACGAVGHGYVQGRDLIGWWQVRRAIHDLEGAKEYGDLTAALGFDPVATLPPDPAAMPASPTEAQRRYARSGLPAGRGSCS